MKFSHEFKQILSAEGFPPHWVEAAVPYGQLKKCIKRVESELRSLGLDAKTLGDLISTSHSFEDTHPRRDAGEGAIAFQYRFTEDPSAFRPKLTLYVQLEDGLAIDATLSPDTRKYLEELAVRQKQLCPPGSTNPPIEECMRDLPTQLPSPEKYAPSSAFSDQDPTIQRIEVPLTFDSEFFGLLQGDVSSLDALQAGEQKSLTDQITVLANEVAKLTVPSRKNKTDLDRWREVFDIYLQAGVFFSTNELDHGSRSSSVALKQLQWFQAEVTKRGLVKSFKLIASREALERFKAINMSLLQNLKFQELNQLAISKILKKFDKRTSLGAKHTFPKLIQSDAIMSGTMAKVVCARVSNEILKIVPQIDDYLCPVCFSISYKPIRLKCSHVFCIRCMIQMQRQKAMHCPLCRDSVVLDADSRTHLIDPANLDDTLMKFLQLYFPKETGVKQRENQIAAGVDMYGQEFAESKCTVM